MVNEAKVQYLKFSVEYMNTMNTEYPYSFTDIQKSMMLSPSSFVVKADK